MARVSWAHNRGDPKPVCEPYLNPNPGDKRGEAEKAGREDFFRKNCALSPSSLHRDDGEIYTCLKEIGEPQKLVFGSNLEESTQAKL